MPARFRVADVQGHVVRGALVYMIGLLYGWITSVPEVATGIDGWATMTFQGTRALPLGSGAIVIFVRARTPQGSLLGGASTRRLVQVSVR